MQKTCNREGYVRFPRKRIVSKRGLLIGLLFTTDQKLNTLKRSILNDESGRHYAFLRGDTFPQFSDKKLKWLDQLGHCYLNNLVQYAFNLMKCSLKAIKGIPIPCIMVIAIFHTLCLYAQTPRKDSGVNGQVKYELSGRVLSIIDGSPMQGVSIRVDAENLQIRTSQDGTFELEVKNRKGKIKFSHVGFKTQEINYTSGVSLMVELIPRENEIDEVKVVSTGNQKIPKERATGSFEFVDSALFNRKVSTDFLSRLEDVVPGISSTKYSSTNRGKLPNINVRGVSSLNSNIWPLIVIDGVPYVNNFDDLTGYFNNINPNDIENISVLKDAAAASIWGAQSGNGVIVITTKKGKFNQPLQLNFNSNLTVGEKPDLYYMPQMNTSDYIDAEKFLFNKGYYNSNMNRYSYNITPVIQLLKKQKLGQINQYELDTELDRLRGIDIRDDFLKYIYRPTFNQQYNIQLKGGSEKVNTIMSLGYDKNIKNLVTSSYERLTVKSNTQIRPLDKLLLDFGITYTDSKSKDADANWDYNVMGRGMGNFPYMELADKNGEALIVDAIGYNPTFRDTIAGGRLLDWKFRPLDELYETSRINKVREVIFNTNVKYELLPKLTISANYAYQRASQPTEIWRGLGSVDQRATLNYYASWDPTAVTYNMPKGDYLNKQQRDNVTQMGRIQVNYEKIWSGLHQLNLLAGTEVRQIRSDATSNSFWGYNRENGNFTPVQWGKTVPALNGIAGQTILRDFSSIDGFTNRYRAYFANANYAFKERYIFSGSVRKDESNLFGVKTNDKGKPFWSLGSSWLISKEGFLPDEIDLLKLRVTYGYNGNVNNSISAYPIMYRESMPHYISNQPYAYIQSPPNPSLRWERVGTYNIGLDYSLLKNKLSGSVEYYVKNAKDLIAQGQLDPSTGFSSMFINSAHIQGKGVDVSLQSFNVQRQAFSWITNLVFSYNRNIIKKSFSQDILGNSFVSSNPFVTPFEGMDLYSLLSFKWAGLDPETGAPRGYVNGEISKDYIALYGNATVWEMDNNGSEVPIYFGSLRNTFRYKRLEISFNIAYQLGHKFRRQSFENYRFINSGVGHADFTKRWQKPGDELLTDVPALSYPANMFATNFYAFSSALVAPADQIKLRDLQFSYSFGNIKRFGIQNLNVYGYAQNITTIWRANKYNVDPEFGFGLPDPLMISLGVNLTIQ